MLAWEACLGKGRSLRSVGASSTGLRLVRAGSRRRGFRNGAPRSPLQTENLMDDAQTPVATLAPAGPEPGAETRASTASRSAVSADVPRLADDAAKEAVPRRRKLTEERERQVTPLYAETTTPVSEIRGRFGIAESSVYARRTDTEQRCAGGCLPPPNQSLRKHACPRRGPGAAGLPGARQRRRCPRHKLNHECRAGKREHAPPKWRPGAKWVNELLGPPLASRPADPNRRAGRSCCRGGLHLHSVSARRRAFGFESQPQGCAGAGCQKAHSPSPQRHLQQTTGPSDGWLDLHRRNKSLLAVTSNLQARWRKRRSKVGDRLADLVG
jgi:hypothetical protein